MKYTVIVIIALLFIIVGANCCDEEARRYTLKIMRNKSIFGGTRHERIHLKKINRLLNQLEIERIHSLLGRR